MERDKIVGMILLLGAFFAAFVGSVLMMGPSLLLMILAPQVYRRVTDQVIGLWLALPVALLEMCFGTKFKAIGHKVANERSVIIMNHRTRIDWLFYMAVLVAYTQTTNLKIILKTQLKKAPCLGWAMQAACFVFLARQWVKDRVWLTSVLKYFSEMRYSFQLLLFPEGVNFCRVGKERSDAYAHKNDLPQYKYVLHPHTTGFSFTVDYLRETKMIDAVYDVTVGYCDVIPEKGELDIFNGNVPKEMQFLIQRYPIDALPQNKEDLNNWCVEKWKEKERRLETFYTGSKTFEGQVPGELVNLSEQSRLFRAFVVTFWIASMLLSVWAMLTSTTVFWMAVLVMAVYVVLGKYFEGVDHLSIASFNFTQDLTHKARTT